MHKIVITLTLSLLIFSGLIAQENFNLEFVGNLDYPLNASDVWGFVSQDSTEYAIMGVRNGTAIIDLSNPANPEEFLFVSGANSIWRDMKTWDNYIYAVADQGTDGLLIVDMSNAPDTAIFKFWQPSITIGGVTRTLNRCHNMWIDEDGYAYLSGCNMNSGGVLIIDLHSDPWNPEFVAAAQSVYSHDNYVRDSMLYSADIYLGVFSIQDITDRTNPVFVNDQTTTSSFTHNCWKSDNGNYIFTTDEVAEAFVDAYDISDPNNIQYLSSFRPKTNLGEGVIPHNVHYHQGFLVISWYTDGVIVVDAHRPENMVKVGQYDTYPGPHGGFAGCWGAFPFLPSGLLLASDIQTGLYVLEPNYVRASYLEGKVISAIDSSNIPNVSVEILTDFPNLATTGADGLYKTGLPEEGFFNVLFSHPDYQDTIISVEFERTEIVELDVVLSPPVCDPPTVQVHSLTKNQTIGTEVTLNWTRGNGDRVLIIAREGADVNLLPSNGQQYSASDSFSFGHDFGMGNFAVYDGTGTHVTISNLELETEYYFALFEYHLNDFCYLLPPLYSSLLTLPETADLALQKMSDKDSVMAGDTVLFTFIITNLGPYEASDIILIDSLPGELEYLSSSPQADQDSNFIEWNFNTLLPGDTISVSLTAMVGSSLSGDHITNSAQVFSETLDIDPDNNFDSVTLFIDCSLYSCDNITVFATETDCGAWVNFEPEGCNFSSGDFFEVGDTQLDCFFDDSCGLPDSCSFTITVIDSFPPEISQCPQNLILIGCNTDVLSDPPFSDTLNDSDYSVFNDTLNQGMALDNCGIESIQYQDSLLQDCPLEIHRTWILTDEAGNFSQCVQEIQIQTPNLFFQCPQDTVLSSCQSEAEVEAAFDSWLLMGELNGGCESTLGHDGVYQSISCGGSIMVTFAAVDNCGQQTDCMATFEVENAPVLSLICPQSQLVDVDEYCEFSVSGPELDPEVSVGCDDYELSFQITGSIVIDGDGTMADFTFSPGVYEIWWTVGDQCGMDSCNFSLEVIDGISPEINCPVDTVIYVAEGTCLWNFDLHIPVVWDNCTVDTFYWNAQEEYEPGIHSVAFFAFDQSGNSSVCNLDIHVFDSISPEIICPPAVELEIPFGHIEGFVQFESADALDNCGVDFIANSYNDGGADASDVYPLGTTLISFTATDLSGNTAGCVTQVQLAEGESLPQEILLSGQISTPYGLLPPSADFVIQGAVDTVVSRDAGGNYQLVVSFGDSVSVSAKPDGDWLDGVTTLDLILIQRKILLLDTFSSPYQHIAADVNRDLVISTLDLVLIQSLILGGIDSIEGNHSWNSIPADFEFDDPLNPLGEIWPDVKQYPFLENDLAEEDWVAVKTGDVSGDAGESGQRSIAGESGLHYEFKISGGDGILSFYLHQKDVSIAGFQLALELPPLQSNNLKFLPGIYFEMDGLTFQYFHDTENGKFRLLAYAAKGKPIPANQPFFELHFRQAPGFEYPSFEIDIPFGDRARFESKMYTEDRKVYLIKMSEKEKSNYSYDLRLSPNPFSHDLKIEFDLPDDIYYGLEILDAGGKSIWRVSNKGTGGTNELNFQAGDMFPVDGLYIIRLEVGDKVVTESVIRVRP